MSYGVLAAMLYSCALAAPLHRMPSPGQISAGNSSQALTAVGKYVRGIGANTFGMPDELIKE